MYQLHRSLHRSCLFPQTVYVAQRVSVAQAHLQEGSHASGEVNETVRELCLCAEGMRTAVPLRNAERPQRGNGKVRAILHDIADSGSCGELSEELRPHVAESGAASRTKALAVNTELQLHRAKVLQSRASRLRQHWLKVHALLEAESLCWRSMRITPRDHRVFVVLASCLRQRGEDEKAEEVLADGCAATQGDIAVLWEARGSLKLKGSRSDVQSARSMYDAALAANRRSVAAWHGIAECERRLGNLQRAYALAKRGARVVGASSDTSPLWLFLGKMERNAGARARARDAFRRGVGALNGSNNAPLLLSWARLEWKDGEQSTAADLLQRALTARPRNASIMLTWALWESELGAHVNAEKLLRRTLSHKPDDLALNQALGRVLTRQQRFEEAEEVFKSTLKQFGENSYVLHAYGKLLAELKRADEARDLFRRGLQALQPESKEAASLCATWASFEASEGNIQAARKLFRACVECDPLAGVGWDRWTRMERQIGNNAGADRLQQLKLERRVEVQPGPATAESVLWPLADSLALLIERSKNTARNNIRTNAGTFNVGASMSSTSESNNPAAPESSSSRSSRGNDDIAAPASEEDSLTDELTET